MSLRTKRHAAVTTLTSWSMPQPIHVPGRVAGGKAMTMAGKPTESEKDAAMLNEPVEIKELATDTADLGARGKRDHFSKPIGIPNLDIVVEKTQYGPLSLPRRLIVECREIERSGMF